MVYAFNCFNYTVCPAEVFPKMIQVLKSVRHMTSFAMKQAGKLQYYRETKESMCCLVSYLFIVNKQPTETLLSSGVSL